MADMEDKLREVEKLRNPYESDHEWKLRRDFMLANYGSCTEDRLVCLANCYINIEVYGCRYPLMVMGQINEMMEGLVNLKVPEVTSRKRGMQLVNFVKSSDSEEIKKEEVGVSKEEVKEEGDGNSVSEKKGTKDDNVASDKNPVDLEELKKEEASKLIAESKLNQTKKNKKKAEMVSFVLSSNEYKSTEQSHETPTVQTFKTKFLEDCQPKPVGHTSVAVLNCQSHIKPGVNKQASETGSKVKDGEECNDSLPISEEFTEVIKTFSTMFKQYRANHKASQSVDVFHMTATKSRLKLDVKFDNLSTRTEHKFSAVVVLEGIELSEAEDSNKKGAKKKAFDAAESKIVKSCLKIVKINPEKMKLQAFDSDDLDKIPEGDLANEVKESVDENEEVTPVIVNEVQEMMTTKKPNRKRKAKSELHGDLSQFIIFEPMSDEQNSNAVAILRRSADASKADLNYVFHEDSTGTRCRITLDGQVLIEYMGTSKTNAKTVASERALERLRQICWTIKVKQAVDSGEESIDRDEVMGDIQKQMQAIPEDNVGNRLLRKMGWSGGGVGAEGNKGKEEPVAVSMAAHTIIRREGLGLSSNKTMVDFKKKVKEIIENYAKSENQDDLAFALCFSKEERAFIHAQCQRLGLKSQSRGTGTERYLTVSRKRSAAQLFDHLMQEGGSTHKYELVPPLYDS